MKNRIGEVFYSKRDEKYTIVGQTSSTKVTVEFEDKTTIEGIFYQNAKNGEVKNPNYRTVYGIGFLGQGKYKSSINAKPTKSYIQWMNMLGRCYNEKERKKFPTYKDVNVCEEWHNFQNFAKWFEVNFKEGCELDKDILCPECKEYSPQNCVFIPHEINTILLRVKTTKGYTKNGTLRYRVVVRGVQIGYYDTEEEASEIFKKCKKDNILKLIKQYKDILDMRVYKILKNYQL